MAAALRVLWEHGGQRVPRHDNSAGGSLLCQGHPLRPSLRALLRSGNHIGSVKGTRVFLNEHTILERGLHGNLCVAVFFDRRVLCVHAYEPSSGQSISIGACCVSMPMCPCLCLHAYEPSSGQSISLGASCVSMPMSPPQGS